MTYYCVTIFKKIKMPIIINRKLIPVTKPVLTVHSMRFLFLVHSCTYHKPYVIFNIKVFKVLL